VGRNPPFTRGPIPTSTADPMFMFVILSAPVTPTVAGLLMTRLIDGKAGYRALLARLLRWRVGLRSYAMASCSPDRAIHRAMCTMFTPAAAREWSWPRVFR
jgi:hypothetical protein